MSSAEVMPLFPDQSRTLDLPVDFTQNPLKAELYAREVHYREAWNAFCEVFGEAAAQRATSLTFMIFKPDAVIARKLHAGLDAIARYGFQVVQFKTFRFDRLSMRELWRYELNIATSQRLRAIDRLLPSSDSLLLLLRQTQGGTPAADMLTALKGPADMVLRRPDHLRSQLGAYSNMINFVHTPDETADVVRELGVLFSLGELKALLQKDQAIFGLEAQIEALYRATPFRDPHPNACLDRLESSVQAAGEAPAAKEGLKEIGRARQAGVCHWEVFFEESSGADRWDAVLAAGHFTASNIVGLTRILK
ncbi:nucleoside-diphosphate kinase [Falsiroseomonas ponticola]|uniref:nucleoside-diphosphate kinase n=1 Tax=Falsiroseomonas ponticola TaxID=2786951 RepID=UPI0019323781|nr:nucleoside-diphosphate kinase [Roseomonas ponticola]